MNDRAPSKQARATMGTSALTEAQPPPPPPPLSIESENMFTEVGPPTDERQRGMEPGRSRRWRCSETAMRPSRSAVAFDRLSVCPLVRGERECVCGGSVRTVFMIDAGQEDEVGETEILFCFFGKFFRREKKVTNAVAGRHLCIIPCGPRC